MPKVMMLKMMQSAMFLFFILIFLHNYTLPPRKMRKDRIRRKAAQLRYLYGAPSHDGYFRRLSARADIFDPRYDCITCFLFRSLRNRGFCFPSERPARSRICLPSLLKSPRAIRKQTTQWLRRLPTTPIYRAKSAERAIRRRE